MRFAITLLSAAVALATGQQAAAQIQVIPAGKFMARDGRPGTEHGKPGMTWTLDDRTGPMVAARLNAIAAQTPLVIDYEHQTYNAEANGQPAPAAGWMSHFDWRPGQGMWADVQWTARAKAAIEGDEYRFISPVLQYDEKTGQVIGIENAALVNHPALLGMDAVQARLRALATAPDDTTGKASTMDLIQILQALFSLPNATAEQLHAHAAQLKSRADSQGAALAALRVELGVDADATADAIKPAVAALKSKAGTADTHAATLQATQALLGAAQAELVQLKGQAGDKELTDLVDGAIAAGKFAPAVRDHLLTVGRANLAQLKALVGAQPAGLAALKTSQTQGTAPASDGGADAMDAAALSVCRATGVSADAYRAQLKAQKTAATA